MTTPAIEIRCSRAHYRAGRQIPQGISHYPAGTFTAAQLDALKADRDLAVVEIPAYPETEPKGAKAKGTKE